MTFDLPDTSEVTTVTEYRFPEGYRPEVTSLYAKPGHSGLHLLAVITITESEGYSHVELLGHAVNKDGSIRRHTSGPGLVIVNPDLDREILAAHRAAQDEQADTFDCTICEAEVRVASSHSMPSMTGSGSDDSLTLSCGHAVTWDPFTGKAHVR
jgi:hypothetical protein